MEPIEEFYDGSALMETLGRLQWLLHRQHMRRFSAADPMHNPSRGQGRLLAMLKLHDGISARDLSYLLGIRVSSLNELLAKLERAGYITREPSEEDRRVMLVKLTDKGRAQPQASEDYSELFACLNEDERQQLGQLLSRVVDALEQKQEEAGEYAGLEWEEIRTRLGRRFSHMWCGWPPSPGFTRPGEQHE